MAGGREQRRVEFMQHAPPWVLPPMDCRRRSLQRRVDENGSRDLSTSRLLMIEANPERAARPVEMLERNCRLQFVSALVGEKERKDVAFYVDESASSVLIAGQAREADLYLPMTTLDRLIKEAALAGPDLIKLDVQGYELPVLCGARRALRSVQAVMMEVNLIEVYRGAALLDEMVAFM